MRAWIVIGLTVGLASTTSAQPVSEPADGAQAVTAIDDLRSAVSPCDTRRRHCLGLHVHVARGDRGAVAPASWIAAQVAEANVHFEAVGVSFELADVATLPATRVRIATRAERTALGRHVKGRVIHVFVTGRLDDVDAADTEINGVAWRKGSRKYIIVSAIARDRTLAHELGHVFGLPHSSYPSSLMNKTPRAEPPPADRTFAPEELTAMRRAVARMLRSRVLDDLATR